MFATKTLTKAAESGSPSSKRQTHGDVEVLFGSTRMEWWREARFGVFIHWGLYALPAGQWQGRPVYGLSEWLMQTVHAPVAEYGALAKRFQPTRFDAPGWVQAVKASGAGYMVVTAKHHDGFAMFRSKASAFNVYDATPFHRDPLKELAAACKKQNLKLGIFYSQAQDWHHAGGSAFGGHWDKVQNGDFKEYLRTVALPQVKELLTNYGPVAEMWWDTPTDMTPETAAAFQEALRVQPGIVSNDRLGGGFKGDFSTSELRIPPHGRPGQDWEVCMTMNDTWGYKSNDLNWKPAPVLLRQLTTTVGNGGNYLLNVGPTGDGEFPRESVDRLNFIGAWLKVNGESIYGTSAGPFWRLDFGTATQKTGKIFLHVFDWPRNGSLTVPLKNKVTKAYLLTNMKGELPTETVEAGVTIKVPTHAPDTTASVVVLEIEGAAEAIAPTPPASR